MRDGSVESSIQQDLPCEPRAARGDLERQRAFLGHRIGGAAVVEANAASGAGIYGCDPRGVLEVLRVATVKIGEAGRLA